MSGRVTGQPPPRPTPPARAASAPGRGDAAGRSPERERRAAPAGEGSAPFGTHRQLGRRGGVARDRQEWGGETQYGRAPQLLPAASSSRLREDAATSRQRQLRWRPRQHHIPLPLASSTPSPSPLPWQRGAKEIGPAPPCRPRLPRPLRQGLGPPLPAPGPLLPEGRLGPRGRAGGVRGVKGGVRKGGAGAQGRAEARGRGRPDWGRGRRENGKASPVPGRTYRSAAEARRGR